MTVWPMWPTPGASPLRAAISAAVASQEARLVGVVSQDEDVSIVEGDGGDSGVKVGHADLPVMGETRRLVSPSLSLRSSTSQHLLPTFLVHFAGGERGGDGLGGGCCIEKSPEGKGGGSQGAECVATGLLATAACTLVTATRRC